MMPRCSDLIGAAESGSPDLRWRTHRGEAVVITPVKSRRFPEAEPNPLEVIWPPNWNSLTLNSMTFHPFMLVTCTLVTSLLFI